MGVSKYLRALPVFSTAIVLVVTFAISAPVMATHKDGAPHGNPGGNDTQAQLDALQAQIDVICENYPGFCTPGFTKAVFLTSSRTDGAFGGVGFADATCQALADAAGRSGTFKAWVSDSASSPSDSFTRLLGPYIRPDGKVVAYGWQDLTDALLDAPINIDESGNLLVEGGELIVWTGTLTSGAVERDTCVDWTSNLSSDFAHVGLLSRTIAGGWTNNVIRSCDKLAHFYCFEQ